MQNIKNKDLLEGKCHTSASDEASFSSPQNNPEQSILARSSGKLKVAHIKHYSYLTSSATCFFGGMR